MKEAEEEDIDWLVRSMACAVCRETAVVGDKATNGGRWALGEPLFHGCCFPHS